MITLSIDPEFKTLIPKLTDSEYGHLEKSIRMEGCRQPVPAAVATCLLHKEVDGAGRLRRPGFPHEGHR